MNHTVHLELVDLASVELDEADAHAIEQRSQLATVRGGDELSGGTTIGLLRCTMLRVTGTDHRRERYNGDAPPRRSPAVVDVSPEPLVGCRRTSPV